MTENHEPEPDAGVPTAHDDDAQEFRRTWDRTWGIVKGVAAALGVLLSAFLIGLVWTLAGQLGDLTGALSRRSPVVDYQIRANLQQSCRQEADDRFFLHVAQSILIDRSAPDAAAQAERIRELLVADEADLADIAAGRQCPLAVPPDLDGDGYPDWPDRNGDGKPEPDPPPP